MLVGVTGAVVSCQDATISGPDRSSRAAPSAALTDANKGLAPEIIVLHGTKGRSVRYVIVGGDVSMDDGHGNSNKHHAGGNEVVMLRHVGLIDEHAQVLKTAFRKQWQEMGLPDIDDADDLPPGQRRDRVNQNLAGASTSALGPQQVLTPKPRGGMPSGGIGRLDLCDEWGICCEEWGCGDGEPYDPYRCTRLYLALYNDQRQLNSDIQLLNAANFVASFYHCDDDPPPFQNINTCALALFDIATYEHWIDMDYSYLNDDAYSISVAGCGIE